MKINPQKYSWPQKMRIKQSEGFDKVSVTEICVFLTRRGTVTDFWFFWWVKKNISRKKSHHVSMLTVGYLWEECEKFWFFIMCQVFSIWLGLSGHSLLRFLAGDLSHSRSVSRSVRPLYFLGLRFDLIYLCKLIVEYPFLGVSCCRIGWGI